MTEYLIAFNNDWVPELTDDQLASRSQALRPVIEEMRDTGVLIFCGGLDPTTPVFSVDLEDGAPVLTDGPFIETKEHLGGFTAIDVADEEAARHWARRIAVACGWPQEVRQFQSAREW